MWGCWYTFSVFVLIADPDYDPNTSFISVEDVEPDVEMDPVTNGNGKHLNGSFPSKQQNWYIRSVVDAAPEICLLWCNNHQDNIPDKAT